jgi:alkylation response protein AidB-like acyl-CoA dehydrogenase
MDFEIPREIRVSCASSTLSSRGRSSRSKNSTSSTSIIAASTRAPIGLTEPNHGSDATWLETTAVRDGDEWVINGAKRFNSRLHRATHDIVFSRTSGNPGDGKGITAIIVPVNTPGFKVEFMWWTFNLPSDHAEVTLENVRVPVDSIMGEEGMGLAVARRFVHENRILQAASGVGAAQFCINESVRYANERTTFGQQLSTNQAIPIERRQAAD